MSTKSLRWFLLDSCTTAVRHKYAKQPAPLKALQEGQLASACMLGAFDAFAWQLQPIVTSRAGGTPTRRFSAVFGCITFRRSPSKDFMMRCTAEHAQDC